MNKMLDNMAADVIMKLPDGDWFIPDEFIQQFGELLVKTCADIVQDLQDLRVPASEYADNIREHFGISK